MRQPRPTAGIMPAGGVRGCRKAGTSHARIQRKERRENRMQPLKEREIGVMFWAGGDPVETLREVKGLGVRCGQMGIPGDLDLKAAAPAWKKALEQEEFTVVTAFAAFTGEDYADAPTVQATVGFIPELARQEREQRTYQVSDFADALGVPG